MIWWVSTSLAAGEAYEAAELAVPPTLTWLNLAQLRSNYARVLEESLSREFWLGPASAFLSMPTPIIEITDPTWRVDYFGFQVYTFISNRLRQAFAVGPDVVRYRDVDSSPSVPEVQALGYCAFDVLPFGNPFDPAKTPGDVRDLRQPDGSIKSEWVLDYMNRLQRGPEIYFRDDFIAPAPIFRGLGTFWVFATDEFADRIMRAGITDMAFRDITGPIEPQQDRIRTLK